MTKITSHCCECCCFLSAHGRHICCKCAMLVDTWKPCQISKLWLMWCDFCEYLAFYENINTFFVMFTFFIMIHVRKLSPCYQKTFFSSECAISQELSVRHWEQYFLSLFQAGWADYRTNEIVTNTASRWSWKIRHLSRSYWKHWSSHHQPPTALLKQ